jgi:hypothetical protein
MQRQADANNTGGYTEAEERRSRLFGDALDELMRTVNQIIRDNPQVRNDGRLGEQDALQLDIETGSMLAGEFFPYAEPQVVVSYRRVPHGADVESLAQRVLAGMLNDMLRPNAQMLVPLTMPPYDVSSQMEFIPLYRIPVSDFDTERTIALAAGMQRDARTQPGGTVQARALGPEHAANRQR